MWNNLTSALKPWLARLSSGKSAYILSAAAIVISTLLVYLSPRSLPAFFLFLLSIGLVYFLKTGPRFKLILAVLVVFLLVPVIGARNISYLEIIFQISVFAALALGLNIVVGFTGLLNLGYVAFYAVGAYLWAFFGSQQAYLLDSIPGTVPAGTPFLLPGDMFYLFILLGVIASAVTGLLLRSAGAACARRLPGDRHPGLW